jgi:hypothetical protein
MQISGVSLTLTWPRRLCLVRVLLCMSLCYKLSPFQALHPLSQACVFIYSSSRKWVFPPLLWSFPPSATLTSFPTPGCWACPRSCRSLSGQARLFYLQFWVPSVPHPLCNVSLLFLLFITQFLFFPRVGVSLSRGLC